MKYVQLEGMSAPKNMFRFGQSRYLSHVLATLLQPSVVLLFFVTIVLARGIGRGEFYFFNDESRHAMNGVFIRDLMVDMPIHHPMQYAYEYYAKYPAVALPHWPPFFPLVEGVSFLIFGISIWAGRFALLIFAVLGVYFWERIAAEHGPRSRSILTSLIFAFLPPVLAFETVNMLEIPQMAMCLGAAYFWFRFLRSERRRDLWGVAVFSVAALLTSQLAIFLVFFFGLHFLVDRRFRLLRLWDVRVALLTGLALVVPWYALSFRTLRLSYQRAVGQNFDHLVGPHTVYYLKQLPQQLGPVLLCLSVIGFFWALFKAARRYRFLIVWVVSAYLCFTLIQEGESRHIMIWIPPLVYFALVGIEVLFRRPRWVLTVSAILASYYLVAALRYHRPTLTGMQEAARSVLSLPDSDIVYYQGSLNGDFIFCVRRLDREKSHMVVREKQIVVTNVVYEQRQILQTTDEVEEFFRSWGIRYALIENDPFLEGLDPVRHLLLSDRFELVREFSIDSNDPGLVGRTISLYRYRGDLKRSNKLVEIPMLTIRSNIRVDLDRLVGRPWPN